MLRERRSCQRAERCVCAVAHAGVHVGGPCHGLPVHTAPPAVSAQPASLSSGTISWDGDGSHVTLERSTREAAAGTYREDGIRLHVSSAHAGCWVVSPGVGLGTPGAGGTVWGLLFHQPLTRQEGCGHRCLGDTADPPWPVQQ